MQVRRGFSLTELMVVVAIVTLLASIAIPNYLHYLAKAKQAEVAINLSTIHLAQQAYFTEHNTYTTELSGPNGAGWRPAGYSEDTSKRNFYYTYGFNKSDGQEGINYFVGKLDTPKDNLPETIADKDHFIVAAVGILGKNKKPDIWTIDEQRNIRHIQNGLEG